MHELLERLARGDGRVMDMCQQANRLWNDFLAELDTADTGTIAARLGFAQNSFRKLFVSDKMGEAMMAWTGFAALYDTKNGWGKNLPRALQLAEAFARSNCTDEVRSEALAAAISYELDKHPDFQRGQMAGRPLGGVRRA